MISAVQELSDYINKYTDNSVDITGNEKLIRERYLQKIKKILDDFKTEYISKELFYKNIRKKLNDKLNELIKQDEYSYGEETGIKTSLNIIDKEFINTMNNVQIDSDISDLVNITEYLESIKDKFDDSIQSRIEIVIILINKILSELNLKPSLFLSSDNFPYDKVIVSDGETEFELNPNTVTSIKIE